MGIYNCASTLQEALDSLYSQTYQDFEIILCDDGSKDNTYELALENQKQHNNIVLLNVCSSPLGCRHCYFLEYISSRSETQKQALKV